MLARKSYAALATRGYTRYWDAVLVCGSVRSETWSGGSTLTVPLRCKPAVAVVRRIGFSFSYEPSAAQMWHFFPWRHGVCFQKGLRTSRVLHDMSSLRVHATHEVVPMVCCQKVTRSVHDVLAKFLTYLTGLYLYTSQRVFSVGLTQIFEGVWLDCPEHNIRQIQNLSGTSVQAQFRAPRQRGSFQSVASRVWKGSICWRQEFAEPSSGPH